ncbi:hypothetical protein [Candidatus Protochlamydia phocaeensis]|uniref:hypothetical protein n=1 Tax=Candidatus Protochlamydia phocaeensis TaxID=1414722 RepID=UPI00083908B3|nr:hypothetical protein [Candidatus Protochlamydia phocaeensis]
MEKNFEVRLCSDLDYEEMVADIVHKNNTFATVSQEKGIDKMEIEIFPPAKSSSWIFYLDDLINILLSAKKNLTESKKIEE